MVFLGIGNNVSNTLTIGCLKMGMKFVLCVPEKHPPSIDNNLSKWVKKNSNYSEQENPHQATKNADIIYTDTWIDMEYFSDPKFKKEKERRLKTFLPYQLNLKLARNKKTLIMHDLPAHPGFEITREAIDCKKSIILEQAENRLHIQKAIILTLLNKI